MNIVRKRQIVKFKAGSPPYVTCERLGMPHLTQLRARVSAVFTMCTFLGAHTRQMGSLTHSKLDRYQQRTVASEGDRGSIRQPSTLVESRMRELGAVLGYRRDTIVRQRIFWHVLPRVVRTRLFAKPY